MIFRECLQFVPTTVRPVFSLNAFKIFRRNSPGKDWNGVWQLEEK